VNPTSSNPALADKLSEIICEADKLIGQVSLATAAWQESQPFVNSWVDPNFAQTIEFSTKFSETLLRKLILLTESLSVEIANFSH